MSKTNLKLDPNVFAQKYAGDLDALKRELRNVQSKKCTLKKRKSVENYEAAMAELVAEEQVLKEARQILEPHDRKVTEYTQADVDMLDYDSCRKAIRSIQSTKCLTSTLADDKSRFENACKIESMLQARLTELKPIDDELLKKKELVGVLDSIKTAGPEMTLEKAIEMIEALI